MLRWRTGIANSLLTLWVLCWAPISAGQSEDSSTAISQPIEEMVVIGTRTKRESRVDDLPVFVAVHEPEDIQGTGEIDLGAALTKLSPSYNYARQATGDGALHSVATLRGLAPDQTLVLVNGKRRHGMAWHRILDAQVGYGSGGTDFRAIPAAAISRVEVLHDGAAAQYGSDAIAGVVSLQLKEQLGHELVLHVGNTQNADGGSNAISYSGGVELGSDGLVNLTLEWHDTDSIRRYGGNGGYDPNYQDELITLSSPSHKGTSYFLNSVLPLSPTSEIYAFGGQSRRVGKSTGAYRFRFNYWNGVRTGVDQFDEILPRFITLHERNTHPVYPDGFLPLEESTISDDSMFIGWRGKLGEWEVDASVGHGRNRFDFGVSNTINASIGAQYLQLNPNASLSEIIANAGPREGDSGSIDLSQRTFNLDLRKSIEGSMLSGVAAGVELRHESYHQEAGDKASWSCGLPHATDFSAFAVGPDGSPIENTVAACGFQGYPGYSPLNETLSDGNRNSNAIYSELEFAPSSTISIGTAIRFEDYSDAGSQLTGKIAGRLRINDQLALRSTISTGFRAPTLPQRRFNTIVFVGSAEGLTTTFSANEGHPVTRAFGIESLDHETSRNWSGGIVWTNKNKTHRMSVDIYSTKIHDRIVRSQGIGCASISACTAVNATTTAFFLNGLDTRTRGVDVSSSWLVPLNRSQLETSVNVHTNKSEITDRKSFDSELGTLDFENYVGTWGVDLIERGQPKNQANVAIHWQRESSGLLARFNHYGEAISHPLDAGEFTIESAQTLDIETQFSLNNVNAVFGISNVMDTLPTELPKTHLQNVLWGVNYSRDSSISVAGRYFYTRLSYTFGR